MARFCLKTLCSVAPLASTPPNMNAELSLQAKLSFLSPPPSHVPSLLHALSAGWRLLERQEFLLLRLHPDSYLWCSVSILLSSFPINYNLIRYQWHVG